jgi:hypothetical protein
MTERCIGPARRNGPEFASVVGPGLAMNVGRLCPWGASMRWSKLKQRTEAMFADGVRGRVGLWTTRYHDARHYFGLVGRGWITIDGRPIANMHKYLVAPGGIFSDGHPGRFKAGIFSGWDLPLAAKQYLTLSIDDAFASENTLVRALAVLDRRAGRRRLAGLNPSDEIPLVAELLRFRLSVASEQGTTRQCGGPPRARSGGVE